MTDWQTYIKNTSKRAPRTLLVKALEYITEKNAALDLGAGALNESRLLIERGFKKVIALDITESPDLIKGLDKKVFQFKKIKIEIKQTDKMTENQQHAFVKEYFKK